MCEHCDEVVAVIVHKHTYYCADCALFEMRIPFKKIVSIDETAMSRKKQ